MRRDTPEEAAFRQAEWAKLAAVMGKSSRAYMRASVAFHEAINGLEERKRVEATETAAAERRARAAERKRARRAAARAPFDPGVAEKRCRHCGITKPADDFSLNAKLRDGLHSWCYACAAAYHHEWLERRKEQP
jgi:inactivated superfamily I helicase